LSRLVAKLLQGTVNLAQVERLDRLHIVVKGRSRIEREHAESSEDSVMSCYK